MATGNLAPFFDLLINGSTLLPSGHKALIETVTVDSNVDGADELQIIAQAYNPTGKVGERWAFVGQSLLAPGNRVTVYAGYQDGPEVATALQRFRIVGERVTYSQGVPKVTIRGLSALARLGEHTEPRAWEGPIADSEIVAELAEEHGLIVTPESLEDTPTRDRGRVKERGTSDLAFLQSLAGANGYGPPIARYDEDQDEDVLYFRAQTYDAGAALTLIHDPSEAGSSGPGIVTAFRADLDLHGVPTQVQVTGWDPVAQIPIVVTMGIADGGQDPVILTGDAASRAGYAIKSGAEFQLRALTDSDDPRSELLEAISVPHLATVEDAVEYVRRWVALRMSAFLTGSATVIGIPSLWTLQVHRFEGLAPVHVGLWEILGCRHVFSSSGYTTQLDLGRILEDAAEPEEL